VSHVVPDGGELVSFTLQPLNPPPIRKEVSALTVVSIPVWVWCCR